MKSSVILTTAMTQNDKYIIAGEQNQLIVWDTAIEKCLLVLNYPEVHQLILKEEDQRVICFSTITLEHGPIGVCRCLTVPFGRLVYEFKHDIGRQKPACLSSKGHFLIVPSANNTGQVLRVYHANTGTFHHQLVLQQMALSDFSHIVPIQCHATEIALVSSPNTHIWDIQKTNKVSAHFVKSIPNWNGVQTTDGKYGLNCSRNSLLQILDLITGEPVHTLIQAEYRQYDVQAIFTSNDRYVIQYNAGRKTIRMYSVDTGEQVGEFYCQAKVTVIASGHSGNSVVLGLADGRVVTLAIVDREKEEDITNREIGNKLVKSLASRNMESKVKVKSERARHRFAAVARVAVQATSKESKICSIS